MGKSPTSAPCPCQNCAAQIDGLYRIISATNSRSSLAASLQTAAETVADVMGTDVCSIFLFDRDQHRLVLRATQGLNLGAIGLTSVALGQGIGGLAAQVGRPIVVDDVHHDPRFHVDPLLAEQRFGSMISVPIILFARLAHEFAGDQLLGVITLQNVSHHPFGEEEVHFLEVVAGELAFFIDKVQRYEQTDERLLQKVRELTTLHQVASAIASTLDLQSVLNMIVQQAVGLSKADRADIFQQSESAGHAILLASYGGAWDDHLRPAIMRVISDGHPLAVVNAYDDERFPELAEFASREHYHSLFCIPLRIHDRIIGVIALYTRERRAFDYEEIQLLSTFADAAAIAIENARLFNEVHRSLHIKTALLKEMDHRVGNNLASMHALLQMQGRQLEPGSTAARILEQSASQIQAMAAVHQLLRGEDVGCTTIQEVARQVIVNKTVATGSAVHFDVLGDPLPIASRYAAVVALVINEFIDNALGHGLSGGSGTIEVAAWRDGTALVLEVRDDGPTRPVGPQRQSTGRGHSIIEKLVADGHGGEFHFERDGAWARACVRLPYEPITTGTQ